jgi:hypothetical protein
VDEAIEGTPSLPMPGRGKSRADGPKAIYKK